MPKRTKKRNTSFSYNIALKKLREYGFKGSTRTKASKVKVKQLWKEYAGYINYTEKPRKIRTGLVSGPVKQSDIKSGKVKLPEKSYNFKFQKLTPTQAKKAKASKLFSKHQFTPKGIFIEKPVNIKAKNFKITFKGNNVNIKGGTRKETMVRINEKMLINDPDKAIKEAIKRGGKKKPKTYSITVNGFRSRHVSASAKSLQYYLKEILLPQWLEKNEDKDEDDFADIFHIRLIY
jgi:hypothetical protein